MRRPPERRASGTPPIAVAIPVENRRVRLLLIICAIVAVVVGAVGQVVMPARGSPVLAWIDTAVIPAAVSILIVLNRNDRVRVIAVVCGLLYLDALITAGLFAVGMAFAIVVPIIGIGLIEPYVRGRALVAAYAGAEISATVGVGLVVFGVPANPLGIDQPLLTVMAFALVSTAALGLMWRASQRLHDALDASSREIASRTVLEIELARTAQLLQALISSSPVATVAVDLSGSVAVWNPAAERMFGWPASAVIGAPLPAGIAPEDVHAGVRDRLEQILAGHTVDGERVHAMTRDGRDLIVEMHIAARRDEAGRPLGLIAQAIDVTERSALEAQLAQAQKMEAVGQLAGGIAHDINNTLTAVGGFAELIEASADDVTIQEDARTISDAVGRARQLTRQLLAFARRSVLQPHPIEVAEFVTSVAPIFRRLLGSDMALVVRNDEGPVWANVDPGQLEQALLNLVVNARDAMAGGGTITIATRRYRAPASDTDGRDRPESAGQQGFEGVVKAPLDAGAHGEHEFAREAGAGEAARAPAVAAAAAIGHPLSEADLTSPHEPLEGDNRLAAEAAEAADAPFVPATSGGSGEVSISVTDTGSGISPELQAQVFEPFFTTKERGRGSGLGLAMVYGFVTQSGGTVHLRSTPGHGTTVEIRLPEVAAVEPVAPAEGPSATVRGSETILLVEDEPAVARAGELLLRGLGYRVLVAPDGASAVETARAFAGRIDLVLSDVIMPGMSGPEAARAVLAIHPESSVLYVSGYTADAIAHRGVLPPGVELVEKPFTAAELGRRVRSILDARAGPTARGG